MNSGFRFADELSPTANARVAFSVQFQQPFFDPLTVEHCSLRTQDRLDINEIFLAEEHHFENTQSFRIPNERAPVTDRHFPAATFWLRHKSATWAGTHRAECPAT